MSRRDDKQVQEALEAIRKLVEVSEDKFEASSDVVTLDNVVWRNPTKDEVEEESVASADSLMAGEAPLAYDYVPSKQGKIAPQSSASISARDLDEAKKQAKPPVTSPLQHDDTGDRVVAPALRSSSHRQAEEKLQSDTLFDESVSRPTDAAPQSLAGDIPSSPPMPLAFMPPIDDDITELTSPIARKGGGFYSGSTPAPKPVIETEPLPVEVQKLPASEPASEPVSEPASAPELARPVLITEPAITDFHGADFNFTASEGLMSASSFEEASAGLSQPITPDVQVPVAKPAVTDPVAEVQAMYQQAQLTDDAPDSRFEDNASGDDVSLEDESPLLSGQPNLHIVSDQSAASHQEEEEGFSSAVRLALRSIIKEQVSSWLQGNMTELIEEALTNPQKRPSSSSKPSSKKR